MLTHNQVRKLNKKIKNDIGTDAPRIIKAQSTKDASIQGIHLLNPLYVEIDDALETALRDNFGAIVIHTARTFGKGGV